MTLGLGVGDPGQLRPFGVHPGTERTGRLGYFRPAVQTLIDLRSGSGDGPGLGIMDTAPFRLELAAHGPQTLKLTARHADGWLPSSLTPQVYGEKLSTLRAHAEAFGRDPETIRPALFLWSALAPTRAESLALLEHPSVRAVALFRGAAAFARHGATFPLPHGYIPHEVDPDAAESLLRAVPDAVVGEAVLHGSPADVAEQLARYAAAGCAHVIVYDIGRFTEPDGTARFREALRSVAELLG